MKSKKRTAWFFIVVLTLLLCVLASQLTFIDRFNWALRDQMAIHLRQHSPPSEQVKLILIDDASVNHLSQVIGRYPWPRGIYSPVLDFLKSSGAKHIYFDVLFSEEEHQQTSHEQFVSALQLHTNIHMVSIITDDYAIKESAPNFLSKSVFPYALPSHFRLTQYDNIYHPIDELAKEVASIPVSTIHPNIDGRYRQIPMIHQYKDSTLMSLPMSVIQQQAQRVSFNKTTLLADQYTIPMNTQGEATLNWYPVGIQKYSFSGVLSSWQSIQNGNVPLIEPTTFEDSIIIIGASAVGLHDLKSTPIHSHLAGAEIQATAISNILNNELLRLSHPLIHVALFIALVLITPFIALKKPSIHRYLLLLLVPISLVAAMALLFVKAHYVLQLALPQLGFWLTYIAAIGYNSFTEYLEKQKVKQTFSMYVSPKILKELSQNYKTIQPELGKEKEVTILFTDIRSFTSLTETHPVEVIIKLLNDYFDAMIEIIQDNDGTVDKIIGDAIMAFWNAPIETENHALKAVQTAQKMQRRLDDLNATWAAQSMPTIQTGIGINTGVCIIGNIGSKRRVNYTLIGDTVNATARLEALCKNYDDNILISDHTYLHIKHQLFCEFIDKVEVKGKQEPLKIYAPRNQL